MSIDEKLAEYRARKAVEFALVKDGSRSSSNSGAPVRVSHTIAGDTRESSDESCMSKLANSRLLSTLCIPIFLLVGLFVSLLTTLSSLLTPVTTYLHDTRIFRTTSNHISVTSAYIRDSTPVRLLTRTFETNVLFGLVSVATLVKITLWSFGWLLLIRVEFGAVYFIVSLMCFMYFSTGRGRGERGAPSAYSVFNKNCERLDGTFTAEQFERELRFGAGNVSK